MIIFEKGDPNSLNGRALIYLRNLTGEKDSTSNPYTPALFAAPNIDSLLEIIGSYRELDPGFVEEMKSRAEEKHMKESRERRIVERHGFVDPLFNVEMFSIEKISGDVIRLPDVEIGDYLDRIMESALALYIYTFNSQKKQKPRYKNFNEMPKEELVSEMTRLTSKIIYSFKGEFDNRGLERLMQMSQDSLFEGDVRNVCELLRRKDKSNEHIIMLYMEKVFAIIQEDFETASVKRDEIKRLSIE